MAFATNRAAATALAEHAAAGDPEQPPYSAFPYDRYTPDFTVWWLVKRPHPNPAYAYSKLEVRQLKDGPGAGMVSVGFRVEKGFAPEIGKQYRKPAVQHLGYTWAWHGVVRALAEGELDGAAAEVTATGLPLVLEVSLSSAHDAEDAGRTYEERVVLLSAERADGLVLESGAQGELAGLNHCTSLRQVGEHLAVPNWQPFFWASLRLGVRVGYAADGEPAWDAGTLWSYACEPWLPWIR